MQEKIACFLELSPGFGFPNLYCPLPVVLVPNTANDFSVECHVFSKIESLADFIQVFIDIWGATRESWPIWTKNKL